MIIETIDLKRNFTVGSEEIQALKGINLSIDKGILIGAMDRKIFRIGLKGYSQLDSKRSEWTGCAPWHPAFFFLFTFFFAHDMSGKKRTC